MQDVSASQSPRRLPAAVIVADARGIIRSVNDYCMRLFGYTRKQLLGGNIKMLMADVYAHQHDDYILRYLSGNSAPRVMGSSRVVQAQHCDGHPLMVTLSLSHVKHDGDDLFCALLEQRKETTVTLHTNSAGKILDVYGASMSTLGYLPSELVGRNISVLCPPEIAERHADYMAAFSKDRPSSMVGKLRNLTAIHQNGHSLPICLDIKVATDTEDLEFIGKITEIVESMEAVISVTDSGIISACSNSCMTMFGYKAIDEIVGQHFSVLASITKLKHGISTAMLRHSDGSRFFGKVDIQTYTAGECTFFRGIITVNAATPKNLLSDDIDTEECNALFKGDVVGWYEIGGTLGCGYFGCVKSATHRLTGQTIAIKCLRKELYVKAGFDFPPREVDLLDKLNHPNIVRLLDVIRGDDCIFMMMEQIDGGELFDYVMQEDHLSEHESCVIFRQIVSAVEYMHRSGVIHRDLKMENILYRPTTRKITVIDLGLGNFYDSNATDMMDTFCGSADYASPELFLSQGYKGPEVDVWSLGVILYLMTTGYIPFNDTNAVVKIKYSWPELKLSAPLRDLVESIFQPRELRIELPDIMCHPFLLKAGDKIQKFAPVEEMEPELVDIDPEVIAAVGALGFTEEDVASAVLKGERNQLSTSYNLLKRLKDRAIHPPPDGRKQSASAKCVII